MSRESLVKMCHIYLKKWLLKSMRVFPIIIDVCPVLLKYLAFDHGPFEVHESGWGEFQITIRLTLHDPNEKVYSLHSK